VHPARSRLDLRAAVATVMTRRTGGNDVILKYLVDICAEACGICADGSRNYGDRHEHCRVCAGTGRE
jgi:hypothetical protein